MMGPIVRAVINETFGRQYRLPGEVPGEFWAAEYFHRLGEPIIMIKHAKARANDERVKGRAP